MTDFPGFKKPLFDFVDELIENNNRTWFNANKSRYKDAVVAPMLAFIEAMGPRLHKVSKHYVADARAHGGSMFRIYRDTRFSKDKRPYKEHVACHFRHEAGKDAHAPGFYFHLEPSRVFFGGGIWMPPNDKLQKIRFAIADNPRAWTNVRNNKKLKAMYKEGIQGEGLKRPPRGFDADAKHLEDLKRKSFFLMREVSPSKARRKDFIDDVAATFAAAKPMLRFINEALDVPF